MIPQGRRVWRALATAAPNVKRGPDHAGQVWHGGGRQHLPQHRGHVGRMTAAFRQCHGCDRRPTPVESALYIHTRHEQGEPPLRCSLEHSLNKPDDVERLSAGLEP